MSNSKGDSEKIREELESAKRKLEELNHFKSHLLTLTSHQFKAPLAAIKGYAELVQGGQYGPVSDKIKNVLQKIHFAAQDLIDLVENIIDVRKIEEGRMVYNFTRFNLADLAAAAVSMFEPIAAIRGLELTFESAGGEFFVSGDKAHLQHVVQNLIDNAVKYTPRGFVRVELKNFGGEVIFSVKDSGMGIKPGTSPLLFKEFVRDERVEQKIRGSGIGLHVAKSIVEDHGGKIWAESEGEDKGSTFYFSLLGAK